MLAAFANCFKIPELKKKILFTLAIIAAYRVGCYLPTPGVNGAELARYFQSITSSASGSIFSIMNMFSGGAMQKMTVFSLGIMPYISSSIIMQLLTAVIPALEKLSKEGQAGYHKINQYTRYGTLGLATIQSFFIALWLINSELTNPKLEDIYAFGETKDINVAEKKILERIKEDGLERVYYEIELPIIPIRHFCLSIPYIFFRLILCPAAIVSSIPLCMTSILSVK